MESHKLIVFGFIACMLAAIAYTFVFADLPFVTKQPAATAPAPAPVPAH